MNSYSCYITYIWILSNKGKQRWVFLFPFNSTDKECHFLILNAVQFLHIPFEVIIFRLNLVQLKVYNIFLFGLSVVKIFATGRNAKNFIHGAGNRGWIKGMAKYSQQKYVFEWRRSMHKINTKGGGG